MSNMVLVVDMLNGFIKEGKLSNPVARWVIPNILDIVQRKEEQGWKIIFVADNHKKDDLEFNMFPEHCINGTDETKVIDELQKFVIYDTTKYDVSNYIPKTRYSALFGTGLLPIIEDESPEEIVIVGIYADICVLHTAADLRIRDYKVTIPKDCTMTLTGIDNVIFAHMKNVLGVNIVDSQKTI